MSNAFEDMAEMERQVRLEKKKTLEAFQANVRIFQLTEKIRAAYESTVRLATARDVDELMGIAVVVLCDPAGFDFKSSAIYLERQGALARVASHPPRPVRNAPASTRRRLAKAATLREGVGTTLAFRLEREGEPLGWLEVSLHDPREVKSWISNVLRTTAIFLGLMAEHLEREQAGPDRAELRQARSRLAGLRAALARPPKGKRDLERLRALRDEALARVRMLEKRLEGR